MAKTYIDPYEFNQSEMARALNQRITNEVAAQLAHALKGVPVTSPSATVELRERCVLAMLGDTPAAEWDGAVIISGAEKLVQYILNGAPDTKNKEGE